ncbi:NADPH-dependent curcumin reductase [Rhodovastum atsumiense]|uniref:NADP-dependent oxidoreductase n=1 Tax=Rhodovastum atsumiense TaxID=504468 RepID=A0A5M6IR05_9PROT|nr:NADP-dependent oxidoreductase [Rhodovastum atsumiense]KAA5609958.1 NADP-dependent oxidoreductase [Rhodovastum atsumiense]CAH2598597.1 NADPH-dependent curcumin reductase [Rhodovastum atsumiense]
MPDIRRSIILRRRPTGEPRREDFQIVEEPVPEPGPGEVLTRTIWLSIDPYMRGRMSDRKSYAEPVAIGGVMTGETVGEVLASNDPGFSPGDVVVGSRGWQTHSISRAGALARIERPGAPLGAYLGVLGMPGTTAYSGMKDIGQPKAGETVVVSAASGGVGSVAGQLAKRAGARVVGIAGGADKCVWVQETLGFDDCVDHRVGNLDLALADACPNGIDVYFENVGGAVQEAVFARLNPFARVVMCGMIAQYNEAEFPPGPNLGFVVAKRVRIEGMIVSDKPERFAEWRALAAPWVADGSLRHRETIVDGLDAAPEALRQVLRGGNFGKMLVRVGREPAGA